MHSLEVAQCFLDDCRDFLFRYDRTIGPFSAIKSRRLKCFNDLRVAYECALKCAVAYHYPSEIDRRKLIDAVEKHRHNIESLESAVAQSAGDGNYRIERKAEVLNGLPVSLRYTLDGLDFLAAHEERYYHTVGSDDWLTSFRAYIEQVFKALGAQLSKHSAIISAADIPFETLSEEEHNKYKK